MAKPGKTISRMGYRDDSQYKNREFIDIQSDDGSISMDNVSKDLDVTDSTGQTRRLKGNSGVHKFVPGVIRETPAEEEYEEGEYTDEEIQNLRDGGYVVDVEGELPMVQFGGSDWNDYTMALNSPEAWSDKIRYTEQNNPENTQQVLKEYAMWRKSNDWVHDNKKPKDPWNINEYQAIPRPEQPQVPSMEDQVYSRFPALRNMGEVTFKADPNFTREATGIGDIEYFGPEEDKTQITYPNSFVYPHPKVGTHGIVYNPETNNAQAIALDMLHGLGKDDKNYEKLRNEFGESYMNSIFREDFERDVKIFKEEIGEDKFNEWYDDDKDYFNQSYVDGIIRNLLFEGSPEDFKESRYWEEAREGYLSQPGLKETFNALEGYLKTPTKKQGGELPKAQNGNVNIGDKTYDITSPEYKEIYDKGNLYAQEIDPETGEKRFNMGLLPDLNIEAEASVMSRDRANRIYNLISPTGYTDISNIANFSEVDTDSPVAKRTDLIDPRSEELYKHYLGINDESLNLSLSSTRPSVSEDPDTKYYKLDPKFEESVIRATGGLKVGEKRVLNEIADMPPEFYNYDDNYNGYNIWSGLGNFTVGKEMDPETGKEYISYYDKYDFPDDIQSGLKGKPYEIYNRINPADYRKLQGREINDAKLFEEKFGKGSYLTEYNKQDTDNLRIMSRWFDETMKLDSLPQEKQGGEYEDMELTPEEIQEYRDGGFIVEDLDKAHEGTEVHGHPHPEPENDIMQYMQSLKDNPEELERANDKINVERFRKTVPKGNWTRRATYIDDENPLNVFVAPTTKDDGKPYKAFPNDYVKDIKHFFTRDSPVGTVDQRNIKFNNGGQLPKAQNGEDIDYDDIEELIPGTTMTVSEYEALSDEEKEKFENNEYEGKKWEEEQGNISHEKSRIAEKAQVEEEEKLFWETYGLKQVPLWKEQGFKSNDDRADYMSENGEYENMRLGNIVSDGLTDFRRKYIASDGDLGWGKKHTQTIADYTINPVIDGVNYVAENPVQTVKDVGNTMSDISMWPDAAMDYFMNDEITTENMFGEKYFSNTKGVEHLVNAMPMFGAASRSLKGTKEVYKGAKKLINKTRHKSIDNVVQKTLPGSSNTSFKSEINWDNWNKKNPVKKSTIDEYHLIEKETKANGTWMKDANGEPFKLPNGRLATAEEFVTVNSSSFKKSYPDGFGMMTSGRYSDDISTAATHYPKGRTFFGGDPKTGMHYAPNDAQKMVTANTDQRGAFDLIYPLDKRALRFDNANQGYKNVSVDSKLGIQNTFNGKPGAYRSDWKGQVVSTDDIATHLEKTGKPYASIDNIFDGIAADNVTMVNHKPGNYLKSMWGNSEYDLMNPGIYKSLLPAIGVGAGAVYGNQESPLPKNLQGGEYEDMALTSEEIQNLRNGGYVVEELPKAQVGEEVPPEIAAYRKKMEEGEANMVHRDANWAAKVRAGLPIEFANYNDDQIRELYDKENIVGAEPYGDEMIASYQLPEVEIDAHGLHLSPYWSQLPEHTKKIIRDSYKPTPPEIIEEYGYDPWSAKHNPMLRSALQQMRDGHGLINPKTGKVNETYTDELLNNLVYPGLAMAAAPLAIEGLGATAELFAATGVPQALWAGANAPTIGGITGTSVMDGLGYYGMGEGVRHLPGHVSEFAEDPTWGGAGNIGLDALGIAGGVFSAANLSKGLKAKSYADASKHSKFFDDFERNVNNMKNKDATWYDDVAKTTDDIVDTPKSLTSTTNTFTPDPTKFYRGIGEAGYDDALTTGMFRPAQSHEAMPGIPKHAGVHYGAGETGFETASHYDSDYIVELSKDSFMKSPTTAGYLGDKAVVATGEHVPLNKGRILKKDEAGNYVEITKEQLEKEQLAKIPKAKSATSQSVLDAFLRGDDINASKNINKVYSETPTVSRSKAPKRTDPAYKGQNAFHFDDDLRAYQENRVGRKKPSHEDLELDHLDDAYNNTTDYQKAVNELKRQKDIEIEDFELDYIRAERPRMLANNKKVTKKIDEYIKRLDTKEGTERIRNQILEAPEGTRIADVLEDAVTKLDPSITGIAESNALNGIVDEIIDLYKVEIRKLKVMGTKSEDFLEQSSKNSNTAWAQRDRNSGEMEMYVGEGIFESDVNKVLEHEVAHIFGLVNDKAMKISTGIDKELSGLDLLMTPDEASKLVLNDQGTKLTTDILYFKGSKNKNNSYHEATPFLAEVRQTLLANNTISDIYSPISEEMVYNLYKNYSAPGPNSKEVGLRLFEIIEPTDKNFNIITKNINKLLGIPLILLAGEAAAQESEEPTTQHNMQMFLNSRKGKGKKNYKFEDGGQIMDLSDKEIAELRRQGVRVDVM